MVRERGLRAVVEGLDAAGQADGLKQHHATIRHSHKLYLHLQLGGAVDGAWNGRFSMITAGAGAATTGAGTGWATGGVTTTGAVAQVLN